jgi:glycosyltransferase involved in cell wall biosynthesis
VRVLLVTNMYPTPENPASGVYVEQQVRSLRRVGVEVDVLHVDRGGRGPRAYWGLGNELRREVDRVQPALVQVAYGGVMAAVVTNAVRDRPVIVHYRGSDLLGSRAEPLLRRLMVLLGVLASRRAAAQASGVLVVSNNVRAALPEGAANGNVWVVPSGVDPDRFCPLDQDRCRARLGWDSRQKHVLFSAGKTRPEKRYGLAEAAVARLREREPAVELHALDHVSHIDVPTWINASDVVLLTSTHEGSPNAVKEALACNVPVVAVDVGDVRERLGKVKGCYVAAPTPDDLADKLRRVVSAGIRVEGRATVADISLEQIAQRLLGIYATVLETGARRPG